MIGPDVRRVAELIYAKSVRERDWLESDDRRRELVAQAIAAARIFCAVANELDAHS